MELCILSPIRKKDNALMAIIWILAFIFTNSSPKAIKVLPIPPKKKKYNSGKRSIVTLFSIKTNVKIICIIKGIFLSEVWESMIVSTFPNVLSK